MNLVTDLVDKAVHYILEKHRQADTQTRDEDVVTRELKQKEKLDRASQKPISWHP